MGKKKHTSAIVCAARSSGSKEIQNLKTLNEQLHREVGKSRKQIEQLRLEPRRAGYSCRYGARCYQTRHLLCPHRNTERAAAMKKIESATAELNTVEIWLISLHREKDKNQEKMKFIVKERDSMLRSLEQKRKAADPREPEHGGRMSRKWIYPVAGAAASFFVATTAMIQFCYKDSTLKT